MRRHRGRPAVLLSGALALAPVPAVAAPESFSPIAFFAGHTEGEGSFKRIAARHRATHVRSNGTIATPGTIVLAQHISVEGKPARDRKWTLRALGDGRYTGTLTDAVGPVEGEVRGNLFHVRFHAKGGLAIQQWMRAEPDGRTVQNHLVVRKFGIRVASLDETIRKIG